MSVTILVGDCREQLATLPDESVQMVCTSPPYFGLRDYGTGTWEGGEAGCEHVVDGKAKRLGENLINSPASNRGGCMKVATTPPVLARDTCPHCGARRVDRQIGLESSLPEYIATLVGVMREVRRVMRNDGTLWLNLGDSYCTRPNGPIGNSHMESALAPHAESRRATAQRSRGVEVGFKHKDLLQVPARVAMALQDDGWWLRSDTIWHKPNPMPESCQDRPTSAHEHLFLLTKSGDTLLWRHRDTLAWTYSQPAPDYRWRHKSGRELLADPGEAGWSRINLWRGYDYLYDNQAVMEPFAAKSVARYKQDINGQAGSDRAYGGLKTMKAVRKRGVPPYHAQYESSDQSGLDSVARGNGANIRNVWSIPENGPSVSDERKPLRARTESRHRSSVQGGQDLRADPSGGANIRNVWSIATAPFRDAHFAVFPPELARRCIMLGSRPGDTVLDPFGGAGTVGLVADQLQRQATLIELNPAYAAMAEKRIRDNAGIFGRVEAAPAPAGPPVLLV